MSRTASVETVNRGEHSCVHPTPKMIDPIFSKDKVKSFFPAAVKSDWTLTVVSLSGATGGMIILRKAAGLPLTSCGSSMGCHILKP